ncbi:MAG: serine hydrolase domain-containing protein [Parvibaculaceae bacterium]
MISAPPFKTCKKPGYQAAFCFVSATALVACVGSEPVISNVQEPSVIEMRADAIAKADLEIGKCPGMAISITQQGKSIYKKGFGVTSIETGEAVGPDVIFPIGSITKSFTALAIAQLAVDGKVDIDASIAEYFDDLPEGWEEIRIRHLLDHTSGIFNYTNSSALQKTMSEDYDFSKLREIWEAEPLSFTPGSQWSYSNSGYYLLGKIIEKASGLSYPDYLQQRIIIPFGLTDTAYPKVPEKESGVQGYFVVDGKPVPAPPWSPTIPFSAGALLSTVGDLSDYSEAVHNSPKVSDAVREIVYAKNLVSGETIPYALGGLNLQEIDGRKVYSHPGSVSGHTSFFSYYPEDNVSIAVLTNCDDSLIHPSSTERKLARAVFGEAQPTYQDVALSTAERNSILGNFSIAPMNFPTSTVGFSDREGTIYAVFGGVESEYFSIPLRYVGNGIFVSQGDEEFAIHFNTVDGKAREARFMMYGGWMIGKR